MNTEKLLDELFEKFLEEESINKSKKTKEVYSSFTDYNITVKDFSKFLQKYKIKVKRKDLLDYFRKKDLLEEVIISNSKYYFLKIKNNERGE